jgi:ABC-type transport system involved in multi-copper enzyme maturation permease subunit
MMHLWTIASLTIKEAIRRRTWIATLLVSLIFIAWAALPLHLRTHASTDDDPNTMLDTIGKTFAWMGCGTIKFFSSILAITLAAGAITTEIDKGVLSVIVPKPMSRSTIYMGKWLGLMLFLAGSFAIWSALLVFAVWHQTGTFHWHILTGLLATFLFPLLFATLTLCFSTFATTPLAAGLSFITAGVALAQDILFRMSMMLDSDVVKTLSTAVGYVVPLGKMNHWITKGLGDAGVDMSAFTAIGQASLSTSTADLVYILVYIAAALGIGLLVFQKRDL